MRPRITVVGGANTDIVGLPVARFIPGDSNPGHVRSGPGGVGRNIAENLARLGARVRLVTAFGDDADAVALATACEDAGIDTAYCVSAAGVPGPRYLAVLDEAGDLAAAVSDMRALDALTPQALHAAAFADADAIVLDTNVSAATIARAIELAGSAPVVLDPVSVAKAPAALPVLGKLSALKANLKEAEALSGAQGAEAAAARLLGLGAQRVFITMGMEGVWCASRDEAFHASAPRAAVVNVTGAGDAFTAGVTWALAVGMTMRDTVRWAIALAAIALESERTVSESVSAENVRERAEAEDR